MKGLFKSKPPTPVELVQQTRELLLFVLNNTETRERKRAEKISELCKLLLDLRTVLYGDGQVEPNSDACAQLTKEFFQHDTFRLLIASLPSLNSGARQNAIHVIANLQRQRVNSKLIASEYLENNLDIMDTLIPGYEDSDIAWTYGPISRECLRHQNVARYVLESKHMKNFFDYLQNPNFDIQSDVQATFKELMTRHKSTVAEFLSENYDWFFEDYNTKLLQSESYITRRHAVKLLGDMLLDRSNSAVMVRYVSSLDNMRIMMNLLRDSKKAIKLDTFHVFKLFVANQNKPPEISSILVSNRSKLLRFFDEFTIDKEDEQFEADKSQIIKEIASLQSTDRSCQDLDNCDVPC
ncbi:Armadillo-like helical [Corchorus capsularis]|uniref:Armadillo-like helical n=1 Tax=Corchorus capsularis TaxID=210143 RepID=A0A1R3JHR5_COCAP|nr:Armadillo-like helical [Corchorus capsularis]